MAVQNNHLECPHCHRAAGRWSVPKAPKSPQPDIWTRREYICKSCERTYETEERVRRAPVHIRVGGRPFSEEKFLNFMTVYAPKRLLPAEQDLIMHQTLANIALAPEGAAKIDPVSKHPDFDPPTLARYTAQAFVTTATEVRKSDPAAANRIAAAHIQYTLATKGSSWIEALQFLEWFRKFDHESRKLVQRDDHLDQKINPAWIIPEEQVHFPIKKVVTNKFVPNALPEPVKC